MKLSSIAATAALSTLLSLSANVHALGEADGVWLKTNFSTQKSKEVTKSTGEMKSKSSKGTCYTQLSYAAGSPGTYSGIVWCQTDGSLIYSQTAGTFNLTELPNGNAVGIDDNVEFRNKLSHRVRGYGSHLLTVKKDKTNAFKSATLVTLGAEIVPSFSTPGGSSTLDPANPDVFLIGGYTTSSKSVPASKVPFL